jgi:hypothetical protein
LAKGREVVLLTLYPEFRFVKGVTLGPIHPAACAVLEFITVPLFE